jgi:signal peptidase I
MIFKYPGNDRKDYIKRCVAGPGQVVRVQGKTLTVDGRELIPPPNGRFDLDGALNPIIADFAPLRIPAKGDTLVADTMPMRELLFFKHLVRQENPRKKVSIRMQLYIDGVPANGEPVLSVPYGDRKISFDQIDFERVGLDRIDVWPSLAALYADINTAITDSLNAEIRSEVLLDGNSVGRYVVRKDNYFMMGDNRDNSLDSRYWGYLNGNFVKAKAFILYFSLDKETPWVLLPLKIRWNRIGKLIRSWDGLPQGGSRGK